MKPRFVVGDRVTCPGNKVGVVAGVFSQAIIGCGPSYTVTLDGRPNALVYHEVELRAAPTRSDLPHKCLECGNARRSHYSANVVRCVVFKQQRSKMAPRKCQHFSPITEDAHARRTA